MVKPDKHDFIPIRLKIKTYQKLAKLREARKTKNLAKTGRVGDASFDTIINILLKYSSGGVEASEEKKIEGGENGDGF